MPKPKVKQNAPPPTEVLSTTQREAAVEDFSTPPKEELATPAEPEAIPVQGEPEPQSFEEQPLTIDEEQEPEEEPTGTEKALLDTKSQLTKVQQELADNKRLLQGVVATRDFGAPGPQMPGPQIPPEMLDTRPTQEELTDPNVMERYVTRRLNVERALQEEENLKRETQAFIRKTPDLEDHFDLMQRIKAEDPDAYVGAGAVQRLYDRAKKEKEIETLKTEIESMKSQAFQAGVKQGSQGTGRTFATPGGRGAGGGVPRKSGMPPADFAEWTTDKQEQWLRANGRFRES